MYIVFPDLYIWARVTSKTSVSSEEIWMNTLEELSLNISWACTTRLASGSFWDDWTDFWDDPFACRSVEFTKIYLFLDDKIISELPKSSNQCFAYVSIYSSMSLKTRLFWYQSLSGCYCENHLEPLKEFTLYGSSLIGLFWLTIALSS